MTDNVLWHVNRLGTDTRIAVFAHNNHIPEMDLTDAAPVGFKVVDKEVGLPAKGSIENFDFMTTPNKKSRFFTHTAMNISFNFAQLFIHKKCRYEIQ